MLAYDFVNRKNTLKEIHCLGTIKNINISFKKLAKVFTEPMLKNEYLLLLVSQVPDAVLLSYHNL